MPSFEPIDAFIPLFLYLYVNAKLKMRKKKKYTKIAICLLRLPSSYMQSVVGSPKENSRIMC